MIHHHHHHHNGSHYHHLDIMLVNPLGFWVAFLDEVSGFMANNRAASKHHHCRQHCHYHDHHCLYDHQTMVWKYVGLET